MKHFLSVLALLAVSFVVVGSPVQAQQRVISFAVTTVNQRIPTIPLTTTSSSCSIIIYSGTGSITAQASSDNAVSWATATPFGSNGVVSGAGTYTATIATTGLTSFGGYLSTAGTGVVGAEVCSSSVATNLVPNPVITGTITAGGYYTATGGFNSGPDCTATTQQGIVCLELDHTTGEVRMGGSTYQGFFEYTGDSPFSPEFLFTCLHAGCTQNLVSPLGNFWGNANAPSPSPVPSGYQGPAVIAQVTAAPTFQPGFQAVASGAFGSSTNRVQLDTNGVIVKGGNVGITTGGYLFSTNIGAISVPTGVMNGDIVIQRTNATGGLFLGGASSSVLCDYGVTTVGTMSCNKPLVTTGHTTCTTSSGNPCIFSWTCTRVSGACTTPQNVPSGSSCWAQSTQSPIASTTNVVTVWPSPLVGTSLTINVQDELGTSTGSYGGIGGCL